LFLKYIVVTQIVLQYKRQNRKIH